MMLVYGTIILTAVEKKKSTQFNRIDHGTKFIWHSGSNSYKFKLLMSEKNADMIFRTYKTSNFFATTLLINATLVLVCKSLLDVQIHSDHKLIKYKHKVKS